MHAGSGDVAAEVGGYERLLDEDFWPLGKQSTPYGLGLGVMHLLERSVQYLPSDH